MSELSGRCQSCNCVFTFPADMAGQIGTCSTCGKQTLRRPLKPRAKTSPILVKMLIYTAVTAVLSLVGLKRVSTEPPAPTIAEQMAAQEKFERAMAEGKKKRAEAARQTKQLLSDLKEAGVLSNAGRDAIGFEKPKPNKNYRIISTNGESVELIVITPNADTAKTATE